MQSYTEREISTQPPNSDASANRSEAAATLVDARQTLATDTLLYGVGEVLNRALPFLLLPLLTRYLSPADFGVASMLTALAAILASLSALGLGAALAPVYFTDGTDAHRGGLLGSACGVLIAGAVVMVGLVAATAEWISQLSVGSRSYHGLVLLTAVGTAFTSFTVPFRQYLQFERLARSYVVLSTISTLITVVFTIALVVGASRGIAGYIEATVLGQMTTCFIFGGFVVGRLPLRFRRDHAAQLLSLGLPLVPAFGAVFLLQNGTRYLLQHFHGVHDVGIFAVGVNIGLVMSVLVTAFQGAWVPFFMQYSNRVDLARIELGRVANYYVFCFGGLSLVLFAIAKPLVIVMTQPAFHDAWRIIGLSGLTQVLNGVFIVLLPGMYFAKEVRFMGLLQFGAAVGSLAVGLALIPRFGVFGAAVSMLLGYALLDVLVFLFNRVRRYLDVQYEWSRIRAFVTAYLAIASLLLMDRNWAFAKELGVAIAGVITTVVLVWSRLTPAERGMLRGLTRTWFVARAGRTGRSS